MTSSVISKCARPKVCPGEEACLSLGLTKGEGLCSIDWLTVNNSL